MNISKEIAKRGKRVGKKLMFSSVSQEIDGASEKTNQI